jgi:hypothetical protein
VSPRFGPADNRSCPDPRDARVFRFTRADFDPASGVARLEYRFDDGPELVERITFAGGTAPSSPTAQAAFRRALDLLHGIAGVSYYKAGLSPELRLPSRYAPFADFLTDLYVHGLAEFGYVNGLDVAARVRFVVGDEPFSPPARAEALGLPDRALVAMGGGKDSLVALDLLRTAGVQVLPACVGGSELIQDTVAVTGLPLLRIGRTLAPELAEMNRAGAWNGHVPVTAINSAILLCAALLYGYRNIIFANERSADEATVSTPDGREINHQYSKSSAFESRFRAVVARHIASDLEYFSVLRPYSELGIVQHFSHLQALHPVYSSCNRNFHLEGPRVNERWCRDCPKCRFAALSLALYLKPRQVAAIQGGDLLNDPAQENGFRALCRLGHDKPFECVGEAGESRAAMQALGQHPAWRNHAVVRALQSDLAGVEVPDLDSLVRPSTRHFIPARLSARLGLPDPSHG